MIEQFHWSEHARFMNRLAAQGFVVLGGPLGDGEKILLIVDESNEEAIRTRLAADPWSEDRLLEIEHILPWTILLES